MKPKPFYISQYEDSLDELMVEHGTETLALELIKCLKDIYKKEDNLSFTDRAEQIRSKIKAESDESVKLHTAGLKAIISTSIVHRLQEPRVNDQAIIIYKYLFDAYSLEPTDLPVVVEGISSIQQEKVFPVDDITNSGLDGKYRAFTNFISNAQKKSKDDKPSKPRIPTKPTLKFGMAILGIIPEELDKRMRGEEVAESDTQSEFGRKLEKEPEQPGHSKSEVADFPKLTNEHETKTQQNLQHRPETQEGRKKVLLGLVGVLVAAALIFIYFFVKESVYDSEKSVDSASLFAAIYHLDESEPKADSLIFYSVKEDNYLPKGGFLIKFRIINLGEKVYFPDKMQVGFEGTVTTLSNKKSQFQLPKKKVEVSLSDESSKTTLILTNSSEFEGIPPRSMVEGFIKVQFGDDLQFEVIPKLILETHSNAKDVAIESKELILEEQTPRQDASVIRISSFDLLATSISSLLKKNSRLWWEDAEINSA